MSSASTTPFSDLELTRSRPAARVRTYGWPALCAGIDALVLATAAILATVAAPAAVEPVPAGWCAVFAVVSMTAFAGRGLYRLRLGTRVLDDLGGLLGGLTLAAMAVVSLQLFLDVASVTGAGAARLWAFSVVYVLGGRAALYWATAGARKAGALQKPTLIVGAGRVGRLVAKRLLDHPELGLRPVAFLDKEPLEAARADDPPVVGASWDLERVVREHAIEQVVITFSTAPSEVLLRLVRRCEDLGVGVAVVPRLYERIPERMSVEHLGALALMLPQPSYRRSWQLALKDVFDRLAAAVFLLLALPLLAAAALAVRLSLGRPILFRQVRIGRDGKPFEMLKLRTMRPATARELEAGRESIREGSAPGGVEGTDRRTRIGALLRDTAIDELPQLLNVLKGDMSMVGPRPERPEFVEVFERDVYRYGDRHRVKAGITGWAQVHGLRGQTSIADRAEWDNYYIENFSLWLDLKIAAMTVVEISRSFAKRLLKLERLGLVEDRGAARVGDHVGENPVEVERRLPADRPADLLGRRHAMKHVLDPLPEDLLVRHEHELGA
jgi:exopolysaccharide biosynthesis polyprenyl glycosylphosphotransferase